MWSDLGQAGAWLVPTHLGNYEVSEAHLQVQAATRGLFASWNLQLIPPGCGTEIPWTTEQQCLKGCDSSQPHHANPRWKVSRCGLYLQDTCGSCSWVGNYTAVHRAKLNTQNLGLQLKTSHLRSNVVFATEECGWNAGSNDVTATVRLRAQSELTTPFYPDFHCSQSFINLAAWKGLSDLCPWKLLRKLSQDAFVFIF